MKTIALFFVVLALMAVMVTGVIYLERYHAPAMAQPGPADEAQPPPVDGDDPAEPATADEPTLDGAANVPLRLNEPTAGGPIDPAMPKGRGLLGYSRDWLAAKFGMTKPEAGGAKSPGGSASGPALDRQPAPEALPRPLPAGRQPLTADRASIAPLNSDSPVDESPAMLRSIDAFELMRWLRSADERTALLARGELMRRGLSEVEIELGRRLYDPDPEIRRQLARTLPSLQSIDAASWLLRLCRDSDAEVRTTAVSLLATSGDMRLLERVEAIARNDPDERVRLLADQIGQQRVLTDSRAGSGGRRTLNTLRPGPR